MPKEENQVRLDTVTKRSELLFRQTGQAWSVRIKTHPESDEVISVGLHWNHKAEPTHEFLIEKGQFWAAVEDFKEDNQ